MKSWQRHFVLGVLIGIVSIVMYRVLSNSIPGYDEDSNLLVTLFGLLFYGVITTILGEILIRLGKKN